MTEKEGRERKRESEHAHMSRRSRGRGTISGRLVLSVESDEGLDLTTQAEIKSQVLN